MLQYLQVEKDEEIALITINRPDKLPARAKDLIFTGRKIGAEESLSMGLINKIFSIKSLTQNLKYMQKI